MMIGLSFVFCAAVAAASLYFVFLHLFRWPEQVSMEELDRRSKMLFQEFQRLAGLEGKSKARKAACRRIAKSMLWQSTFLLRILDEWYHDHHREKHPATERALATSRQAMRLRFMLCKFLFLLRFRPSLLQDCHRLRAATLQFYKMWAAFFRFCQALHPDP